MLRQCAYCKTSFRPHTHNHSYCSESCRDRNRYLRMTGVRPADDVGDIYVRRAYSKIVDARSRGLGHSLSLGKVEQLLTSPCYYCGKPSIVIERFDNDKGYSDDNVVPSCARCNKVKGTIHGSIFMKTKDMDLHGYAVCLNDGRGGLVNLSNGVRYVPEPGEPMEETA